MSLEICNFSSWLPVNLSNICYFYLSIQLDSDDMLLLLFRLPLNEIGSLSKHDDVWFVSGIDNRDRQSFETFGRWASWKQSWARLRNKKKKKLNWLLLLQRNSKLNWIELSWVKFSWLVLTRLDWQSHNRALAAANKLASLKLPGKGKLLLHLHLHPPNLPSCLNSPHLNSILLCFGGHPAF